MLADYGQIKLNNIMIITSRAITAPYTSTMIKHPG